MLAHKRPNPIRLGEFNQVVNAMCNALIAFISSGEKVLSEPGLEFGPLKVDSGVRFTLWFEGSNGTND